MAFVGMRAGDKRVAAFNLVHQPVSQKKIKSAIDRDGCRPCTPFRHAVNDVIGANSRMALRHAIQNVPALTSQFAAAPLARSFRLGNQVRGAMGVIMLGIGK